MTLDVFNRYRSILLLTFVASMLAACSNANIQATQSPQSATIASDITIVTSFELQELEPTYEAMIAAQRDPRIPNLPFFDNPDPSQCGIPTQWGTDDPAWLSGIYEGELIQPTVFLYESHLRLAISGEAPHGSEVTIVLFQNNPITDYYMVEVNGTDQPINGWIPAPLLSFEPVEPIIDG